MKLEKKVYTTRSEKQKDFFIGVGIFIGLNVLLSILPGAFMFLLDLFSTGSDSSVEGTVSMVGTCISFVLPFLGNIAAVIYFALTRSWIAIGILGAIAILFVLSLLAIIVSLVACFLLPSLTGIL